MAPKARKRPIKSDKKVEKHSIGWFDLPLEMREIVIDKMDPKTRCNFAQCSKWCEYEAKKSNKYLYKIGISQNMDNYGELELLLWHEKTPECNIWFEFLDGRENQTIVVYRCETASGEVAKWTTVESGPPKDVRLEYFNEYMEKYEHCIRGFHFNDRETSLRDININNFKNLEELDIGYVLQEEENLINCGFIDMEKLMWIKHLDIDLMLFKFNQIIQLKGEEISILSEDFDENNINKYLKMMKKGEIHENVKKITVLLESLNRINDIGTIMNGLNVIDHVEDEEEYFHTFSFSSNIRKNGKFWVKFEPRSMIEIEWKRTE